jgi:hypothetical protein
MSDRKKYYSYEKKNNSKWVQKSGTTCDDITFTDGKIEIDFDGYMNLIKKENERNI